VIFAALAVKRDIHIHFEEGVDVFAKKVQKQSDSVVLGK